MKGNSSFFHFIAIGFLCLVSASAVFAQESNQETGVLAPEPAYAWFFEASVLFFPEDNGVRSDPMLILPSPGAGFGISLFGSLRLEITLDMYFGIYGYDFELDRPVPRAWENRSAFVWGSVLGIEASWVFRFTPDMTLRLFGGPSADLRLVLLAPDLNEAQGIMDDIQRENRALTKYFWSAGRWFLPVLGTGMDFGLNENFKFGFDLRLWIPAYKIWTNENLPFAEGWRLGMGARITLR